MKYTIFGDCVLYPDTNIITHAEGSWGSHFDRTHKGNIKWYMAYEQSNLQVATQVMLFSKPDSVNIVQPNWLHRTAFIDTESPKSYNALGNGLLGDSCFADVEPTRLEDTDNAFTTSTWQSALRKIDRSIDQDNQKITNQKDKDYLKAWSHRNYMPQGKWEMFLSLALMCKHADAVGHDIRIIPKRHQDFNTNNLSKLNKIHCEDILKHVDHRRIFWHEIDGKKCGTDDWPTDSLEDILANKLQPWLDSDI